MTMAANLEQAALLSMVQCSIRDTAGTLKTNLQALITAVQPVFPDAEPTSRPVGNWIPLLQSITSSMVGASTSPEQLNTSAEYLYRMCYLAAGGITTAQQKTDLLAAWNANIGT